MTTTGDWIRWTVVVLVRRSIWNRVIGFVILSIALLDLCWYHSILVRTGSSSNGANKEILLLSNLKDNFHDDEESSSLSAAFSPLHDKTIHWDPKIPRLWLQQQEEQQQQQKQQQERERRRSITEQQEQTEILKTNDTFILSNDDDHNKQQQKSSSSSPPGMVLLTNYGWNHPDQSRVGLQHFRSLRSTQLVQGVVDHPWFHPTAFEDFFLVNDETTTTNIDPNLHYYVFLDVETCFETNYPKWVGGFRKNSDLKGNRIQGPLNWFQKFMSPCYHLSTCPYISKALKSSPLFSSSKRYNATLIVWECQAHGPSTWFLLGASWWTLGTSSSSSRTSSTTNHQLSLATESSELHQLHSTLLDQGLPPPTIRTANMTQKDIHDIETCNAESNRPYLLSFVGHLKRHPIRLELSKLATTQNKNNNNNNNTNNNNETIVIMDKTTIPHYGTNATYIDIMMKSIFVAAPRGDAPFTYRFSEALSAGAIPVLYSDHWVLPFHPKLIAWDKCIVQIPEQTVHQTLQILRNITQTQRCTMRQYCWKVYHTYFETPQKTIAGLIDGIETALYQ